ncbi:hypothetical protein L204_103054 [Cryptococcus depauperatus]
MRSLSPLALTIQNLPPGQKPSNLVVDPETDSLYVAVETAHQDLQVEILKVQRDSLEPVASFTSPVISPFPKPTYLGETLSLHYLADDRVLVALLAGGDIVTVTLEGPDGSVGTVEVVGSVESGIKAAAWSPDDEQIILVTGEDNIVCMTRNFDVIHEEPLRSEDFGEDKFINVGWGSKSTQFHGSIGKSAARQSTNVASSFSHPTDHGLPTISFRGDASFFAISSLDSYSNDEQRSRRQIRIYSRDASAGLKPKLSATSESLPGLEPALAWRPSGNLISTMIRYGYEGGGEGREGRWDVGMIERNGLRHGGFELREHKDSWKEGRIRGLGWNSDSEVLAVWVERKDRDVLQLWSMKNYHYYLKQELFSSEFGDTRFRGFKWHPEEPLSLFIIQDNSIQHRTFTWDTYASRLSMPRDTASVAVVDGTSLLVTPFRTQNTPPPMSSYQLTLPSTPVHACLSDWEDKAAAVFSDGEIIVWKLNTRLPGPKGSRLRGGGRVAEPEVVLRTKIGGSRVMRNIALGPNGKVAVLSLTTGCEQSGCVNVFREKGEEEFKVQGNVERILWTQEEDGEVLVMNGEGNLYSVANPTPIEISFPSSPTSLLLSNKLLFALSPNSKLDVLAGAYRRAFLTCRKHRLDLNILYDLDPSNFMDNLDKFVEQVPEVDYLNLFVSSLNGEDSVKVLYGENSREGNTPFPVNKVNTICDSLRRLIVARGVDKYIETILTTHVCKVPADYEAGLEVLLQLQTDYPEIVENAIKYIIFLSDVNKLYDVALGMYNFQLVLMVAQYSQKDPKEYLPFLRELRALDKWDQRFRIDDHLERRERALANLKQAGDERFDEAVQYLAKYELYDTAFKLYADENHHLAVIYDFYGDYLYDRREFTDAALPYLLANKPRKALKAYERAHAWRELFTLAKQEDVADLSEFIERVTDYLGSRGRHLEAAQVFIEYAKDIDSAVDTCCQGTEFSEAYRLVSVHDRKDLIEAMIHPGLEEAQEALVEIFEEMEEQLDKETKRLCELKDIRERDYDAFYIVERELDLEGVDVATNATTVASQFTRYTVAPSTMTATTRMTGQTNRTKRGKKRATGRRGTVDEWEYLVMSIGRLLARVDEKSSEAITLLRHLLLASPDHTALAKSLQSTIISFRTKLSKSLDIAWQDREVVLKEVTESGGSGLEGGLEKSLGEVKPIVGEWKGLGFLLRD